MPVAIVGDDHDADLGHKLRPLPRPKADADLTRRDVAELLGCHQDSVTRKMPDGLASAVTTWGGNSKLSLFSHLLVSRFVLASRCQCARCRLVVEDAQDVGAHLIEARHGAFESCGRDCGHPGQFCLPCEPRGNR
jgi:hypothetical protein